jgi:hypothetical protein
MSEDIKLVENVIMQIFGYVEDEGKFNTLDFMKNKLKNQLTTHLGVIIRMFVQILKIFLMIELLRNGRLPIVNM